MLETLAELVERDGTADMIDSTIVRAHHCAVGIKRGLSSRGAWSVARRLHHQAACPLRCQRPSARLRPDGGGSTRHQGLRTTATDDRRQGRSAAGRQGLRCQRHSGGAAKAEIEAVIPAKRNRKDPAPHDAEKYKWRNLIERLFNKLKNWRRVATRCDKTRESYLGFVAIAAVKLWLPFVHEA